AATATSLDHLAGHPVDREALLVAWLRRLDHWIGAVEADPDGRRALIDQLRERSATLGRAVRVELASGVVEGEAVAIDENGHLQVAPSGSAEPLVVAVGDIVHLRPIS
ncbi:MAG: biotin--[acetyl-CoA-carboxylase] ligase, partial [Acidobacteria bacterium]|nr:biotin--[acetyl-CoA-carboxylase] ligase [Acidobacteriota bacterium]